MHQNGFNLIIRVVPHHYPLSANPMRQFKQKMIAAQPRGFLNPQFISRRECRHILPFAVDEQTHACQSLAQNIRLARGILPYGVVEMTNDERETGVPQAVQKAEAVRPARHTYHKRQLRIYPTIFQQRPDNPFS